MIVPEDLSPDEETDDRFGPACRAVFKKLCLRLSLYNELVVYFDETPHTEWYWRLVEDSHVDSITARQLCAAMHSDTGCPFDEDLCLATPPTY